MHIDIIILWAYKSVNSKYCSFVISGGPVLTGISGYQLKSDHHPPITGMLSAYTHSKITFPGHHSKDASLRTAFKLFGTFALYSVLTACSPPSPPQPGAQRADGNMSNGVVTYSAADFHEPAPGRNGGTLKVSAASDAGSFDIHA